MEAKHFYVSAIRSAKEKALIAGPYSDHETALAKVRDVARQAEDIDPRAHFWAWGTAGSEVPFTTPMGAI